MVCMWFVCGNFDVFPYAIIQAIILLFPTVISLILTTILQILMDILLPVIPVVTNTL